MRDEDNQTSNTSMDKKKKNEPLAPDEVIIIEDNRERRDGPGGEDAD